MAAADVAVERVVGCAVAVDAVVVAVVGAEGGVGDPVHAVNVSEQAVTQSAATRPHRAKRL